MATNTFLGLSSSRQQLLDAARGVFLPKSNNHRRILRCFPLTERNIQRPQFTTPNDFHTTLCRLIVSAKRRVYLASLYVGPAANPASSKKEVELLNALRSSKVSNIKIILDKNRALRPVPLTQCDRNETFRKRNETITSAGACYSAIETKISSAGSCHESGVYLFSVLPWWQQQILPNPYNEIAGVFHLKCYIIDDDIILSGANLSEEYFCDRIDRYLWLTSGDKNPRNENKIDNDVCRNYTNDIIEYYARLVDILCQQSERYSHPTSEKQSNKCSKLAQNDTHSALIELLTVGMSDQHGPEGTQHIKTNKGTLDNILDESSSARTVFKQCDNIVAYAVPTIQVPPGCISRLHNSIPKDTDIFESIIKTASKQSDIMGFNRLQILIASAYLNLTDALMNVLAKCKNTDVHALTAGSISHGFKPNPKKTGNKGKSWIPAVFDALSRRNRHVLGMKQCLNSTTSLWYYQRADWTFHAKGVWLTSCPTIYDRPNKSENDKFSLIKDDTTLLLASHGSGNYGARSAVCDMESNVYLVFSDTNDSNQLRRTFQSDWNRLCEFAGSAENESAQSLPFVVRILLPVIRRFF